MPTSQPLMALFSTDVRLPGVDPGAQRSLPAGEGEAFAGLLAAQLPAELESAIHELSPEQLAALEQASLAVGGNNLPLELQDWLQQLPEETAPVTEDALAVISQWMQLLQQDAGRPAPAGSVTAPLSGQPLAGGAASGPAPVVQVGAEGDSIESLEADMLNRSMPGREPAASDSARPNLAAQQTQQIPGQPTPQATTPVSSQPTQNSTDFSALLQRTASEPNATAAALFGKLVEQMEGSRAGRAEEADVLDGLQRAAGPAASAAALTARPVAGAMQPATVPFGHQSWGEAMVERVMWMSSQNLNSVEIQLDPAELGPLEIHIQNRGQELQVQFVSQNPSVREALEGQMHRLREMLAGQGLEQAAVTVGDRSAGEQAGRQEHLAGRDDARGRAGSGGDATGEAELPEHRPEAVTQPRRGLVDFYV